MSKWIHAANLHMYHYEEYDIPGLRSNHSVIHQTRFGCYRQDL